MNCPDNLGNKQVRSKFIPKLEEDKKCWIIAARNNDGYCSEEEYFAFVYSELLKHMQSLFAKQGELNQLNKNKDNLVDKKEFITDEIDFDSIALNPNSFSKYIDKDNDGVLNKKDHEFFFA